MINTSDALKYPDKLSPQVRNLIAMLSRKDSKLIKNTRIEEGVRLAEHIDLNDLEKAVQLHSLDPFMTHKMFNISLSYIKNKSRIKRYITASIDLEILLDRLAFPQTNGIIKGIPEYIMDGYTDLGQVENETNRGSREKFRVEKNKLRTSITRSRQKVVLDYFAKSDNLLTFFSNIALEVVTNKHRNNKIELFNWLSYYIISNTPYNEYEVDKMSRSVRNETISIDKINYGVCRHHAVLSQVMLQVMGIRSKMTKGNHYFGRHVWNRINEIPELIFDSTRKSGGNIDKSPIVSIDQKYISYYEATSDSMNNYKIVHKD